MRYLDEKAIEELKIDTFASWLYRDYIITPVIQQKGEVREDIKTQISEILEKWKQIDQTRYEQGLEVLANIQALASDTVALEAFRRRNAEKVPILENLRLYELSKQRKDFSNLEQEDLITQNRLDPVTEQLLKMKFGKRLTLVSGRDEYYMDKPRSSVSIVNQDGERIVISEKGSLNYHTWSGVKDFIPCYEVTKQKEDKEQIYSVFTRIKFGGLDDPEYVSFVAEHLLSDEQLLLQNYGGYIGEMEPKSRIPEKERIDIPGEDTYCIYYDATALTAAKLYERQRQKEEVEANLEEEEKDR